MVYIVVVAVDPGGSTKLNNIYNRLFMVYIVVVAVDPGGSTKLYNI